MIGSEEKKIKLYMYDFHWLKKKYAKWYTH